VFGPDPSGPGRDHIEVRDKTANNLLSISSYTEEQQYIQTGAATPGEFYTASLRLSRTAEGITVQSKIGNTEVIQSFATGLLTKFDSLGIFSNGNTGSFTIDNVQLQYSGVPEPNTFFGMALFGVVVVGRIAATRCWGSSKSGKLEPQAGEA